PAPGGFAGDLDRVAADQELPALVPTHGARDLAILALVHPVADQPFEVSQRPSRFRRLVARGRDVAQLAQSPPAILADGDEAETPRGERGAVLVLELETARDRGDVGGQEVDRFGRIRDLARRPRVERFGVASTDRLSPPNLFPVTVEER